MKKHSLMLALLGGMLVATSLFAGPAFADDPDCGGTTTDNKCIGVLWSKKADVWIELTDGGVTHHVYCHHNLEVDKDEDTKLHTPEGDPMLRKEAFNVCVGGNFEVGNNGNQMVNLNPSRVGTFKDGKFGLPFVQIGAGSSARIVYLESNGQTALCDDGSIVPLYRLDKQDLDGNPATTGDSPLLLGTIVNVITENLPNNGKCIGVRTTFQFRVGTCKIWKVRKYFNACSSAKRITQIKEFEQVHDEMNLAGGQVGPGGAFTAVGQENEEDHYITLTTSNTQANPGNAATPFYQRSTAGSVGPDDFELLEFCGCRTFPSSIDEDAFTSAQVERDEHSWLEVFLSYFPGGVNLQGKGKSGSEKFITWFIDVE
jgi:hypothetical protein